jgi:hypothetical protein
MTAPVDARLLDELAGGDPTARARFDALAPDEAAAVVDALKARLDALVRRAPTEAGALADVLVACAQRVPSRLALALRGRAMVAHANQRSQAALTDYEAALALYREAGDELEVARVQRSLVDVHQMLGHTELALATGAEARAALERLGEKRLLAQLLCNVGNVHFRLDAYPAASASYEEARGIFAGLGDGLGEAFALFNLGNTATNANRFDAARDWYTRAEAVFRANGHHVLAADSRYSVAYLEMRRGDYAAAHEGLVAVRAEYERGGKPSGAPLCDLDLAEMHLRLEAHHDALECAQRASAAFAALGMRYEHAKARAFAGLALVRLGRADEGDVELVAADQTFAELGNDRLRAMLAFQRPRRAGEGTAALEEAARVLAATGSGFLAQFGTGALARARFQSGDAAGARVALDELLAAAGHGALERLVLEDALELSADLALESGDRAAARVALERSLELAHAGLRTILGGDVRIAFARGRQARAARLAQLHLESGGTGSAAAALEILDAARQRSQDELRDRSVAGTSEEDELRRRADALLARHLENDLGASGARVSRAVARERASELDGLHHELAARARRSGPWRHDGSADLFDWRSALAPDERVLYHLSEPPGPGSNGALWVIAGARDDLVAVRSPVPLARIEDLVEELRFEIGRRLVDLGADGRRARAGRARVDRCLAELGAALVPASVAPRVRGPLVVVPYGVLHDVPYQALIVDGAPLVAHCEISYASSLRALARARTRPRATSREVWLCGEADARTPRITHELDAIESLAGRDAVRVPVGELVPRLAHTASGPRILHVASHGAFRPDHPLLSGLRLGERFLTTFDVHRTAVASDLVCLSGCETGRRARRRGEELVGPEQAFLASGARAVLGSGWTVADESAARCMEGFYAELARGLSVRAALAAVQRSELALDGHPFGWAAFHASGDPDVAPLR